jgi:hypothetical protein
MEQSLGGCDFGCALFTFVVKGSVFLFSSSSDSRHSMATLTYAEHLDFAWSIAKRFDIMRRLASRGKFIGQYAKNETCTLHREKLTSC